MNLQSIFSAFRRAGSPLPTLLAGLLVLAGLVARFALADPLIPFAQTGKALALRAELREAALSRNETSLPTVSATGRNTANGRAVLNRSSFTPSGGTVGINKLRLKNRSQSHSAAAVASSGTTPVPGAVQTFDVFNPPPSFRPLIGYQNADGSLGNDSQNPPVYAAGLTPTNLTPVWSQDETFLVFSSNRDASGNVAADGRFHLWAISINGGQAFQITTSTGIAGGGEFFPSLISSNNTELAFNSDAQTPGVQNLYAIPFSLGSVVAGGVTNVSDANVVTSLTNVAGTGFTQVQRPTISPTNSNLVVFSAFSTTGTNANHSHLYFLYLTTGGFDPNNNSLPAKLTDGPADDTDPAYSNDGQFIAFASTASSVANQASGSNSFSSDPNQSQSLTAVANGTTAASNRSLFLLSGGVGAPGFGTVPSSLQSSGGRITTAGTDNFGPAWSFITPNQFTNQANPGFEYLAFARGTAQNALHDIYYLQTVRSINAQGETGKSLEAATTPEPASTPVYQIAAGSQNGYYPYTRDTASGGLPFYTGGVAGTNASVVNTNGDPGTNPQIYSTFRVGNANTFDPSTGANSFTYTIPDLTPTASYTVKLHFSDPTDNQPGKRVFNVSANGQGTRVDIASLALQNTGTLAGLVTNAATGLPVSGAAITVTDLNTGAARGSTTTNGGTTFNYSLTLSDSNPSDAYVVTVSDTGFGSESRLVHISTGQQSQASFALTASTAATQATISGTVYDSSQGTGTGVPATVTVGTLDTNNLLVTYASVATDNNGVYTLDVPAGVAYYVTATPPFMSGYQTLTQTLTPATGANTENFPLNTGAAVGDLIGRVNDATAANTPQIAGATIIVKGGGAVIAILQSSGALTQSPAAPAGDGGSDNYNAYLPTTGGGTDNITFAAQGYGQVSNAKSIVNTPQNGQTPPNEFTRDDVALTSPNGPATTGNNTAVVVTLNNVIASSNPGTPATSGQIVIHFTPAQGTTDPPLVNGIDIISDTNAPTSSGFGGYGGTAAASAPQTITAIGGTDSSGATPTVTVTFGAVANAASYNIYRTTNGFATSENNPNLTGTGTESNIPYMTGVTSPFVDPNVTVGDEYFYQVTAVITQTITPEAGGNAVIKLVTENNPPSATNAYDDIYPTWSPFRSDFSIAYASNRSVSYNDPTTGLPSEVAISLPEGSAVAGSAGASGYAVGANYSGILESQVLNLDPPTLLRFSGTETVHVQPGSQANPVTGTATKYGQVTGGQAVTLTVRLSDRESGIDDNNIYIQIKDPDGKYQDSQNLDHKVFARDAQFDTQGNRQANDVSTFSANEYLSLDGDDPLFNTIPKSTWPTYSSGSVGYVVGRGARGGYWGGSPAGSHIYIGKTGGGTNQTVGNNYTTSPNTTFSVPGDSPDLFIPWGPEYECQFVNAQFGTGDPTPSDYGTPYYLAGVDDQQPFSGFTNQPRSEWLHLTKVPANEQDNLGGTLYTATWTTPTSGSDFYLDVIAYDKAAFPNFPAGTSSFSGDTQNWRIYDNVGGFSTNLSIGNNDILVVSDYALGQKFAGTTFNGSNGNKNLVPKLYGAESYLTDIDVNVLPDTVYAGYPYLLQNAPAFPTIGYTPFLQAFSLRMLNGLGVGSYADGITGAGQQGSVVDGVESDNSQKYSIWRILSRGPVPQTVLNAYLPTKQVQPAVIDLQGPAQYQNIPAKTILDAHKCVVWLSPYTGDLLTDPGALDDPGSFNIANQPDRQSTQTILRNFVQAGGRLFLTGQDVASGLTLSGTVGNSAGGFLSDVLNATLVSPNGGSDTLIGGANRITGDPAYDSSIGTSGNYPQLAGSYAAGFEIEYPFYPYQNNLILGSNSASDGSLDQRLDSLDLPSGSNLLGQIDSITPQNGATAVMNYGSAGGAVAMVIHDDPYDSTKNGALPNGGTGSRVVYAAFGLEGLSSDVYAPEGSDPNFPFDVAPAAPRNPRQNILHNIVCYLRTGSVSGLVTQTAGTGAGAGQGVSGVTVYLVPISGNAPPTRATFSASTDQNGVFTILGVEPGTYTLAAYKPGYSRAVSNAGVSFTVEGDVNDNNAALTITPLPPGNIAGNVDDASGNPIPDVTVTFTSRDQTTTVRGKTFGGSQPATATNPSGYYFLPNVPVTEYDTATATSPLNPNGNPEYTSAPAPQSPFNTATAPPYNTVVTVQANTTTQPVNFVLPVIPASISGHLYDTSAGADTPANIVPGTTTVTLTNTATGAVVATVTADASSNYTFANVPAGLATGTNYTVTATNPAYATGTFSTTTVYPGGIYQGDQLTGDIGLAPLPTVSGMVTNAATAAGISGATVTFTPTSGSAGVLATATTAADGTYTSALQPGSYTINATAIGFNPDPNAPYTVTVATGDRKTQNFSLPPIPPGTISGTVTDDATPSNPVGGATVTFTGTGGTTVTTTTAANGTYSQSLPPDTYSVTASLTPQYASPAAKSVTVTSGQTSTANFTLVRQLASISGRIYDMAVGDTAAGALSGATVTLTDSTGAVVGTPQTTGADGLYSFTGLTSGTYTVTATKSGYLTTGNSTTLTVNYGDAKTADIALSFIPPGSVNGTVTDNATPASNLSGATVTLTSTDTGGPAPQTATTNASGGYAFATVFPGHYTVTASLPQYLSSAAQAITVTSSAATTAPTLVLTPITLGGLVTDTAGNVLAGATITVTDSTGAAVATTPASLISQAATTAASDGSGPINYLARLAPGTYTVTVTLTNFATQTVTVTVNSQAFTRQNFTLVSTMGTLGGLVANAADSGTPPAPVGAATVTVTNATTHAVSATFTTSATATSAPDGSGSINYMGKLPQGTYTVTVTSGTRTSPARTVTINSGQFSRVDFTGANGLPSLYTFRYGKGTNGLNFLSTPYDYSAVSFDTFFGPLNTAAVGANPIPANANRSHVAVWNPLLNAYALDPTAPADALRLGVGYWVYLKTPVGVTTQGGTPSGSTVSVALYPSWNQIGVPSLSAIPVANLAFSGGSTGTLTFAQASGSAYHLVSPTLYRFDGVGYQPVLATDSLQPWQAYWIQVYADATLILPTGR